MIAEMVASSELDLTLSFILIWSKNKARADGRRMSWNRIVAS